MTMIAVRLSYAQMGDDYMHCPQHDVRLEFQPDRKAVSPLDPMHWYMCSGLEAEIGTEGKFNVPQYAQEIEDRDARDRAQWVFVAEIEDPTVTVG